MEKQRRKPKLPKPYDKPQFENESLKRSKINLSEKPKKPNDSKNENLLLLTGNERAEEDVIHEPIELFMKQNDVQLENLRRANDYLKKKHENEIEQLKNENKSLLATIEGLQYENRMYRQLLDNLFLGPASSNIAAAENPSR